MKKMAYMHFLAPLVSVSFFMVSSSFFMSFLSLKMQFDGYSKLTIGAAHSAYYGGLLFGAFLIPRFIHGIGHIRVFAGFAAIAAVTMLLIGQVQGPHLWIFLRFIMGVSLAAMYVVLESWLLCKSSQNTQGRVLSLYMITLYLSQAGGQMLLQSVNYYTLEPYLLAGTICTLGIVPICLTRSKVPEIAHPVMHGIGEVARGSPFGFFGCVTAGMMMGSIYGFGPNYAQISDISPSYMMGSIIIGGVVLQWPIGKLSDFFDRRKMLVVISFVTAVPCLLIPLFSNQVETVLPLTFALGGLAFTVYPLSINHACDRFSSQSVTSVAGVLLVAYGAGAMLGPLAAPYFMLLFGIDGLFIFIATALLFLGLYGVATTRKRAMVPKEDQGSFISLPSTTAVAYDLSPREQEEKLQKEVSS